MRVIEFFSCSGGMAEGFRRAGVVFDLVFDMDPDACDSYEKNLGHRPIQMDVRDLLRLVRAGASLGAIDLIVADPPCTPWSRAGKRLGADDERDMLATTCELIALLRPREYLIGNVMGLQDSTAWGAVQEHIGGLTKHGYCVADHACLNAADHGVPQKRIRPFWFGHLEGPCLRWPAPTHAKTAPRVQALPGMGLLPWVTCRDALGHLPLAELGRPVCLELRKPGEWSGGGDGHSAPHVVLANSRHPPASPASPANTVGGKYRGQSEILRADENGLPKSWKGSLSQSQRAPFDVEGLAPTVLAREDRLANGASTMAWPWAADASSSRRVNAIILSEKAVAILQGFPETWVFSGATKKARWGQIGQAMPPPMAQAVA